MFPLPVPTSMKCEEFFLGMLKRECLFDLRYFQSLLLQEVLFRVEE
jgi:hypothetical protein